MVEYSSDKRVAYRHQNLPTRGRAIQSHPLRWVRRGARLPLRRRRIALIGAISRGDDRALENLYDRYAGTMLALARRILGDTADADEIVVHAFTKVWRSADRYDAQRGSVIAWLVTIVRSRAIDRLRARRSAVANRLTEAAVAQSASGSSEDPGPVARRSENRAHVSRVLAELPEGERRAIELALYEGMTHGEIATVLGEPPGTIKTRIRSGMQRLKIALEPVYPDEIA